jgi:acyl carrier protein
MTSFDAVKSVLRETLQLGERADLLEAGTPLFGSIPELDSMAVVTVITAIEDRFGIEVDDDEITAATFETVGSLSRYVDQKLAS